VRVRPTVLCFLTFVLFTSIAAAQSPNGTVSGIVLDPSGGVIVGADVLIINNETGTQYPGRANNEGFYVVSNIPPGTYRIQVSNGGFKTIIKPDIVIHVLDALAINFTLPIGAASEIVTVPGGAPLVNTENAAVSTVMDRKFVENLPSNGRSFNTLLQLTPGVVIASTNSIGSNSAGQFSISGQRTDANSFSVDGVSANFGVVSSANPGNSGTGSLQAFSALGGTSSLVSVDALQEFRVVTSSFAPEYGRSPGGQVVLTTRSGTNDFHGGAFEYFRNIVLDANNWFANQAGLPRAPERHNDFGGYLGGRIWKDKTFFFFSYEGARLRQPVTNPIQVPSEYARTTAPSALSPYIDAFPQPDDRAVVPGVYTSQFTGNVSNVGTLDAASIRIDHNFSDRFSIFGRYNHAPSATVNRGPNSMANNPETTTGDTQTMTLGANMPLTQNIANTARGNYSKQTSNDSFAMDSVGGAVPIISSLLLGSSPSSRGFAMFSTNDTSGFSVGMQARNQAMQLNFVDDLAVTTGAHQLKFGGDYRAIFLDAKPYHDGVFLTADTVQGFISTSPGTAHINTTTSNPSQILAQSFSLYGQDTWKLTPRLTLTYGVRWELAPAPSARNGTRLASWTSTNVPSTLALAPLGKPIWATTYGNFAPRFGLAYRLTPRGDFVFRTGFGLFYDTAAGKVASLAGLFPNTTHGPPAGAPTTVTLPVNDFSPYSSSLTLQPPFPIAEGFVNDLQVPRSYQWNVALEKSFAEKQVFSATYVGQAGRRLLRQEGLFQPNLNFSSDFLLTENTARSNYNALQLQYRCPLSARIQALLNYTWSHSLDNSSDDSVSVASHTVISAASDYANSTFDVRHSFSGAIILAFPAAAKTGIVSALTRDWSLGTVIVARTGFPFNLTLPDGNGPVSGLLRRPNLVTGQPVWIGNIAAGGGKSLNPAAFAFPPFEQQGTEPRNDIPGFGLTQVDLSIARKFLIKEPLNLQFRADAFNVFNHPNFANPLGFYFGPSVTSFLSSMQTLNNGLGGLNSLFQEGGPRSLQLSLKLNF
jgi:hypothetical protein